MEKNTNIIKRDGERKTPEECRWGKRKQDGEGRNKKGGGGVKQNYREWEMHMRGVTGIDADRQAGGQVQ